MSRHFKTVAASTRMQAPDYGAPAGRSDFAAGLILLSLSLIDRRLSGARRVPYRVRLEKKCLWEKAGGAVAT